MAVSGRYARGDENNADRHGALPGYATLDLDAHWHPAPAWDVFAAVDNVLDRRYATYGELGNNVFDGPGMAYDPAQPAATQFRAMAAPRAWRIVVRRRLD